ncbi:alpha-L-rhamnosidase C [Cordyceps javanica]|uniref:Alpha-L-rhamnosidase C n=1 Tax=Cordyceps javanica TaxID=43265 RepID=A0A545VKP3_9HYPO|nr:alpha-L-rhamnosidase C [Cordyceps javanica]TQW02275.1 alpha-L-rhamnosidase C [Cordyceps javanica]
MASSPRRSSEADAADSTIVGRARRASLSVLNANPQLGIWQAAGTAIAQAPNLTELRDMDMGAENITFNSQGHSARLAAVYEDTGRLALVRSSIRVLDKEQPELEKAAAPVRVAETPENAPQDEVSGDGGEHRRHRHHLWHHSHGESHGKKAGIGSTIMNGLAAFWKFFITPAGFLITIYCLNIVAWGAMLFFLLLKAAPAMNHPSADDNSSPRKIWLEIDSQILNALFCVTGFGLAPWRFRDLYYFIRGARMHDRACMTKLVEQNRGWFRPPTWYTQVDETATDTPEQAKPPTFTGRVAPPTPVWKLGFTIWMMVWNTILQAVLCFFMWHYNRIDRPSWATGTFIGLGCGVSMLAGLMSYWEGRKVKKIEGPAVEVVEAKEVV